MSALPKRFTKLCIGNAFVLGFSYASLAEAVQKESGEHTTCTAVHQWLKRRNFCPNRKRFEALVKILGIAETNPDRRAAEKMIGQGHPARMKA